MAPMSPGSRWAIRRLRLLRLLLPRPVGQGLLLSAQPTTPLPTTTPQAIRSPLGDCLHGNGKTVAGIGKAAADGPRF